MARQRPFHRTDRLNRQVQQILAVAVQQETREEALRDVMITAVEVTRDLSIAKVHYFPLGGEPDAQTKADLKKAFGRAAGFLRSLVGRELRMRHVPELRFMLDTGITHGRRIEEILDELNLGEGEEAPESGDPEDV